jgi:hypothetical protein
MGAGASQAAGSPLMQDFLDRAEQLVKGNALNDAPAAHEAFSAVFDALEDLQRTHAKSAIDLDNLEAVFSAFEMAGFLEHPPMRTPHADVRKALVRLIWTTLGEEQHLRHHGRRVPGPRILCPVLRPPRRTPQAAGVRRYRLLLHHLQLRPRSRRRTSREWLVGQLRAHRRAGWRPLAKAAWIHQLGRVRGMPPSS